MVPATEQGCDWGNWISGAVGMGWFSFSPLVALGGEALGLARGDCWGWGLGKSNEWSEEG